MNEHWLPEGCPRRRILIDRYNEEDEEICVSEQAFFQYFAADSKPMFTASFTSLGERPFSPNGALDYLNVTGHLTPPMLDDKFAWAELSPNNIFQSDEPTETLTLIPYGYTNLRLTEFP